MMENGIIGKFEGIPFKSDVIPIKDGDTLVITVDPELITVEQANIVYEGLSKLYPNNTIVCLIKGITLAKENEENKFVTS